MDGLTKAETIKLYREATGIGWLSAKLQFSGKETELCRRILRAYTEQGPGTLHDPIEDDQEFSSEIEEAKKKAEYLLKLYKEERTKELLESGRENEVRDHYLGSCHYFWKCTKEELKKKGIDWYSPKDLNPGTHFD